MPLSSNYISTTSFDDFDPNTWVDDAPMWAVYTGSRFKAYASRGPALNAVLVARCAKLYELDNGKWVERAVKPVYKPTVCDECGQPTLESQPSWDRTLRKNVVQPGAMKYNYGEYVWRKVRSKIPNPPELVATCRACRPGVVHG